MISFLRDYFLVISLLRLSDVTKSLLRLSDVCYYDLVTSLSRNSLSRYYDIPIFVSSRLFSGDLVFSRLFSGDLVITT